MAHPQAFGPQPSKMAATATLRRACAEVLLGRTS